MSKPAARAGDHHICPKTTSKVPHVGGPVATGSSTVLIDGLPAARVGDTVICNGPPDTITSGSSSVFIDGKPAATLGSRTAHGGVISQGSGTVLIGDSAPPIPEATWRDHAVGTLKAVVNQVMRQQAALMASDVGVSYVDAQSGEAVDIATAGRDLFALASPGERAAAATLGGFPQTSAVLAAVAAIMSRGRSLYSDPRDFLGDIQYAIRHSRSEAEAFGVLTKEQAKRRKREASDPNFIDRYHGKDDMTRTQDERLNEWEVKASQDGYAQPATNKYGEKQGSRSGNLRYAQKMTEDKAMKIGQPSNRQGGPYTQGEIDLWREVKLDRGNKEHTFVRVNTTTNQAQVYRQDNRGNLVELIDEFEVEGADQAKAIFREAFKK